MNFHEPQTLTDRIDHLTLSHLVELPETNLPRDPLDIIALRRRIKEYIIICGSEW